jgi:hypothetical protein
LVLGSIFVGCFLKGISGGLLVPLLNTQKWRHKLCSLTNPYRHVATLWAIACLESYILITFPRNHYSYLTNFDTINHPTNSKIDDSEKPMQEKKSWQLNL